MEKKNVTINDIAKMAGVSKTTVSRYLNGKFEYMSVDTKERIEDIIELVNYQPSNIARSLKSQKSHLIGVVVADIESPFSSAAIKSIGDAISDSDYNIIIANADNNFENEKKVIRSIQAQQVDGFIVNTSKMINPFLIELANSGVPIVLLDRFVKDYFFDISYIENYQSMETILSHLVRDMGYGCPAFFTQPHEETSPRYLRYKAFTEITKKMGIENSEELVFTVRNEKKGSVEEALHKLLEISKKRGKLPAIISGNGVTLMHIARAITNANLAMPYEIGLSGYDEWGWASSVGWAGLVNVGLTTLEANIRDLGMATVEMLLNRINHPHSEKRQVGHLSKLIIRKSTLLNGS